MPSFPQVAVSLALLAPAVLASDLNVSVESGGSNTVTVNPGTTVNYTVVGELSDLLNEGLAGVSLDLKFTGGDLTQADAPTSGNMLNFTDDLGLSNPAGYGGTVINGDLIQIGGMQNTFKNSFTTKLSGGVVTGVAWNGSPEVLVTGTLTAPFTPGTYSLQAVNVLANVIVQGEDGTGEFWAVELAGEGQIDNLVINVAEVLSADVSSVSLLAGGDQNWTLDAGLANGGRNYWVFGSFGGTSPGTPFGLVALPLNTPDAWFNFTLTHPNMPPLVDSFGTLSGTGTANAKISIPPASNPGLAGLTVNHAYLLGPTIDFSSNPVSLTFLP